MAEQNMGLGAALVAALISLEALPPPEPPHWLALFEVIDRLDLTMEEALASADLHARFQCSLEHLPTINHSIQKQIDRLPATPSLATILPDGW